MLGLRAKLPTGCSRAELSAMSWEEFLSVLMEVDQGCLMLGVYGVYRDFGMSRGMIQRCMCYSGHRRFYPDMQDQTNNAMEVAS